MAPARTYTHTLLICPHCGDRLGGASTTCLMAASILGVLGTAMPAANTFAARSKTTKSPSSARTKSPSGAPIPSQNRGR